MLHKVYHNYICLQMMHPHVHTWGSLLRLYGRASAKSNEKKVGFHQLLCFTLTSLLLVPLILHKLCRSWGLRCYGYAFSCTAARPSLPSSDFHNGGIKFLFWFLNHTCRHVVTVLLFFSFTELLLCCRTNILLMYYLSGLFIMT